MVTVFAKGVCGWEVAREAGSVGGEVKVKRGRWPSGRAEKMEVSSEDPGGGGGGLIKVRFAVL